MSTKTTNLYRYVEKAKPFISKQRFSHVKIDELVKHMDISKATFYKYFTTKDDVLSLFIQICVDYLNSTTKQIQEEDLPIDRRFQKLFEQSLKSVMFISDLLLQDLKEKYPAPYEESNQALQNRNANLQPFFSEGKEKGIFRSINTTLFMLQDDAVLRQIIQPSFTIQYDMTVKKALLDFYLLKKYQLFEHSVLETIDDSYMERQISSILQSYLPI